MFSCEFCENFQNTFFYRTPLAAASVSHLKEWNVRLLSQLHYCQAVAPGALLKIVFHTSELLYVYFIWLNEIFGKYWTSKHLPV